MTRLKSILSVLLWTAIVCVAACASSVVMGIAMTPIVTTSDARTARRPFPTLMPTPCPCRHTRAAFCDRGAAEARHRPEFLIASYECVARATLITETSSRRPQRITPRTGRCRYERVGYDERAAPTRA